MAVAQTRRYNRKGAAFHRAGKVQSKKWRAYFDKHIKDRISEGVVSRLHVFSASCKAERKLTVRARQFQSNFKEGQCVTALAVFDPDTRKIVKQYSSKASARTAALILLKDGYACEWDLTTSNVKSHMDMAEDPSKPLFGYQWLPTEAIKSGNFKIKPYFRGDHLVSPTPCNIVILKEDTTSGVQQVRGFESKEAAYRDWLSERETSFSVNHDGGGESLSDFIALYLDGDKSIKGMVWNRVHPREDNLATILPKSPGKVVMGEEKGLGRGGGGEKKSEQERREHLRGGVNRGGDYSIGDSRGGVNGGGDGDFRGSGWCGRRSRIRGGRKEKARKERRLFSTAYNH